MIKKCTGCGIILQTEDINKEGYTENIDNELCLNVPPGELACTRLALPG